MADFSVNLSQPQGAGSQVLQPVRQQEVPFSPDPLLTGVVDIFAKGLEADKKQQAVDRKNAVIGEYAKNEQVYSDALTSGQWTASMVGTASRANYTKLLAAYPEYTTELAESRKAFYEGTEVGEAQRQVDAVRKLREEDKGRASAAGYTFFDGMSPSTEDKLLDSYKTTIQVNEQTDRANKAAAENRANKAEGRAEQSHVVTMQQYQDKENARKGLLSIADKNFDALGSLGKDLLNNPAMPFEQKQLLYADNVNRIKTGLLAISSTNPELAAPWQKLVEEMQSTFTKLSDPTAKTAQEAQILKDQFDAQQYKAKLLITTNADARNAVAISSLFPNNPDLLSLAGSPVVVGVLAQYGLGPGKGGTKTPIIGQPQEKQALDTVKGALKSIQTGQTDPQKNTEAVNTVNEVLRQNATMQGPISAPMLKNLSSFYSSPEFGKLAASGQLDSATLNNVKNVFQVSYEPAVKQAIQDRLEETIRHSANRGGKPTGPEQKIYQTVDVKFTGSGVQFVDKPGASQTLSSSFTRSGLDEAASGLNTLIRMGAHMEGTTNYAKYWEDNKHYLLPNIYPDPVKLKPGQVQGGYKYLGGPPGDERNWERVSK